MFKKLRLYIFYELREKIYNCTLYLILATVVNAINRMIPRVWEDDRNSFDSSLRTCICKTSDRDNQLTTISSFLCLKATNKMQQNQARLCFHHFSLHGRNNANEICDNILFLNSWLEV